MFNLYVSIIVVLLSSEEVKCNSHYDYHDYYNCHIIVVVMIYFEGYWLRFLGFIGNCYQTLWKTTIV